MEGTSAGMLRASNDTDNRLLRALAEELKLPLLQIARQSELDGTQQNQVTADMALTLIDGYILGLQTPDQTALELEPVTLSSVLQDTAHALQPVAARQGYEIVVDIAGRYGPVMGDRRRLQTAFTVLGYELMNTPPETKHATITLATHRSRAGLVAGVFTDNPLLSAEAFRRAKALVGSARQTFPGASGASGAGVFIADTIIQNLSASFRIAHHAKQTGLATTLLPSQQLELL